MHIHKHRQNTTSRASRDSNDDKDRKYSLGAKCAIYSCLGNNRAAPAQHVHALYTRCEDYRKQVLAANEKLQQEKFERKQMKAELENGFKEQLESLRISRTYTVVKRDFFQHTLPTCVPIR